MASEKVFREALEPREVTGSGGGLFHKMLFSAIGWSVFTFVFLFAFLYMLNPPIVQCTKTENDMSKPTPNTVTIAVLSGVGGLCVLVASQFLTPPAILGL
jgi:hypothetical protein